MKAAAGSKVKTGPSSVAGSEGARKAAAVILEVLSGLRTTGEACEGLGISPMRYYVLETRALQGLVGALEPRAKGKRRKPEDRMRELEKEKARLERDLARTLALVRLAQRAIGIPAAHPKRAAGGAAKPKRRRRGQRAMRAIVALRAPAATGVDGSAKPAAAGS